VKILLKLIFKSADRFRSNNLDASAIIILETRPNMISDTAVKKYDDEKQDTISMVYFWFIVTRGIPVFSLLLYRMPGVGIYLFSIVHLFI
jgi:hypothetical protein